jgi:hypothetical protein
MQPHHAVRLAARVPDRGPTGEHPTIGAVLVPQPVLALIARGAPVDVCLEVGKDTREVIRVHSALPLLEAVVHLVLGIAQHGLPAR